MKRLQKLEIFDSAHKRKAFKTCSECSGIMKEMVGKTPEGIAYNYYRCTKCGEEVVDMKQLHNVAERYREIRAYYTNISKWGLSLGFRVPKELAEKYHLGPKSRIKIIPEKEGMRIIPA